MKAPVFKGQCNHAQQSSTHTTWIAANATPTPKHIQNATPKTALQHQNLPRRPAPKAAPARMNWTTWWLWRGDRTRSHPELGRENPQRPWYCVSRHGRVGRRQVFQSMPQLTTTTNAGWSSPVARQAHNLKVIGSNPIPATTFTERTYPAVSTADSSRFLPLFAFWAKLSIATMSPLSTTERFLLSLPGVTVTDRPSL